MGSASQMPILYDRDCGFCRVSVALVLTWDRRRRLRPVAIQSEEGQRLLASLPEEERLASAHVVEGPGAIRSGGAAVSPILAVLPGGRPLARVARFLPHLSGRGYRAVAHRRAALGRLMPDRAKHWADTRLASRD